VVQRYTETQKVDVVLNKPNPSSQNQISKPFKGKYINKQVTAHKRIPQAVSIQNNKEASSETNT
jgi:hypothetical protein